jgi:acyl-CoA reductase-like NAD-dependent aldehyde dehydrogenase
MIPKIARAPFSRALTYRSPRTGQPLGTIPFLEPTAIAPLLANSVQAYREWSKLDFDSRLERLELFRRRIGEDKANITEQLWAGLGKSYRDGYI